MPSLRVFVASPGDVPEERDVVSLVVVPELRRIFGDNELFPGERRIDIEAIRWETHTWPDVGQDAQDVINQQIGEYDILVGIMWRRFGTPTTRAESGTGEEFQRAYDYFQAFGRPKIMFYFRTTAFYPANKVEWEQFGKVLAFKEQMIEKGVRFTEYGGPLEFERYVREHLVRQIFRLYNPTPKPETFSHLQPVGQSPERAAREKLKIFLSYAREDLAVVREVYDRLAAEGFDVWLDVADLLPGQRWDQRIKAEIKATDVVLVFTSSSWMGKRGFIFRELRLVLDQLNESATAKFTVIPVRLDSFDPTPELGALQWFDYFQSDGQDRLVEMLERIARNRSGTPDP